MSAAMLITRAIRLFRTRLRKYYLVVKVYFAFLYTCSFFTFFPSLAVYLRSYDLMNVCRDIGEGKIHIPELLGDYKIAPITTEGAYQVKLDSTRLQNERLLGLLNRYTNRTSAFESYS